MDFAQLYVSERHGQKESRENGSIGTASEKCHGCTEFLIAIVSERGRTDFNHSSFIYHNKVV